MPLINPEQLAKLVEHYMVVVAREHGDLGIEALKSIMETLTKISGYVDPETLQGPITIFKTVDPIKRPLSIESAQTIIDLSTLSQDARSSFTLQILDNGQFLLWNDLQPDLAELAKEAVVYLYQNQAEYFFAGDKRAEIPKVASSYATMFSSKKFGDLIEVLEHYRVSMVCHSTCYIFRTVWRDTNRIFFMNAPEHIMRDSLTQFLRSRLRGDVYVHPEQNVDETKPVDIRVIWMFSTKLALIEVKWLGKSMNDKGTIVNRTQARALEGANQLADYLDRNLIHSPKGTTRGYLVIIDGRRYGTNKKTLSITIENGFHYQDAEIEFNPKYHETRNDFERPIRMFAEPICQ